MVRSGALQVRASVSVWGEGRFWGREVGGWGNGGVWGDGGREVIKEGRGVRFGGSGTAFSKQGLSVGIQMSRDVTLLGHNNGSAPCC